MVRLLLSFFLFNLFIHNALATPDIQYWRLENGARIYFVESHELPMVQINVAIDAGSARDPQGKFGLAQFTVGMLNEGTVTKNTDQIAEAFENLGAEFGMDSGRDKTTISLTSLSQDKLLRPAIDVFNEVLLSPTFPTDSLVRERQRTLIGLQKDEQSPAAIVAKNFFNLVYGKHPYAHDAGGTEADILTFNQQDLKTFHKRYYVGSNTMLVIVGDVNIARAKELANQIVGSMAKGTPAPTLPPVESISRAKVKHINFPSSQTHIRVGEPGMSRIDPDYFPLYIGNFILGGSGLISQLSNEIREKQGLAYSVYSYFWPLSQPGPFLIGLQTKNKQRDKALKILKKTLTNFIKNGPSDEELIAAKKNITGGFPMRIDSNGKIANYVTMIGFYRLPLSYLDDFNAKIESVTGDQIRSAFKRRVNAKKQVTVTVGGKK